MNEKLGVVTKQFPVLGSSFENVINGFVLFDSAKKFIIYDTSGNIHKNLVLSDEFEKCNLRFVSKLNVIGFNAISGKIIISKIIF